MLLFVEGGCYSVKERLCVLQREEEREEGKRNEAKGRGREVPYKVWGATRRVFVVCEGDG